MIPVIINNFNRLSTTRNLVVDLLRLGYTNIHILDNGSTYEPLLNWYNLIEQYPYPDATVKVERLGRNVGSRALWDTGYINQFTRYPYIVYTDSDIQLNPNTPTKFIEHMWNVGKENGYEKVGLALDISDLPETPYGDRIRNWEGKYWQEEVVIPDVFKADVDTTFAVISPCLPFDYKALRIAGNFTAKHIPWYTDFNNLTEEERYVMDRLDNKHSTYKGYYLELMNKN